MGPARRRLVFTACALGTMALLASVGVLAQTDPRNESPEYFDAINGAQCYEHHIEQGFNPYDFRFTEAYSQLPIDEVVPIKVQIIHRTAYTDHTVEDMTVTVNTEQAPNVEIVTDDIPDPIEQHWGPVELENSQTLSEHLDDGATRLFVGSGAHEGALVARVTQVHVEGTQLPLNDEDLSGSLTLRAGTDDNRKELQEVSDHVRMELDKEFFESRGRDNYTFDVTWRAPHSQLSQHVTAEVELGLWVNFTSDATEVSFPSPTVAIATGGQKAEVEIPLRITSEEPALLDFRIRATAYWQHDGTDGAVRDDGVYIRFLTMQVEGGEELIQTAATGTNVPVPGQAVNLYNLLTRLLGFIGLFLVVAALFTGGVFGKSSRRWMNKATGGAKKRVLWHSSMGFLIVVVATVHFMLAVLESLHDVSKGLLWGGLAWTLLISLGFTGYYQVRMIKKWNYRVWRHVHLWSAVAVLLFVLVHVLLEGSDLSGVRDLLPSGYEKLVWPRP